MRRYWIAALALFLTLPALPAGARNQWLGAFTTRVLQEGHDARLPPHLSLVLGLGSGEEPVPVRQLGVRAADGIHTFNVATLKGSHIAVLLHDDDVAHLTQAFVLEASGALATAVSYAPGAQPQLISKEASRSAFRAEMSFWSGKAAGSQ